MKLPTPEEMLAQAAADRIEQDRKYEDYREYLARNQPGARQPFDLELKANTTENPALPILEITNEGKLCRRNKP